MDKGKAEKNLKEILDRMNDTDTARLLEYYKLLKKGVPFFKRSWAAAWLFMYYDRKEIPREILQDHADGNTKNDRKVKQAAINVETGEERSLLVTIPEEESKRLFISIGKNRRLFPKEIISLIMSNTSSKREDIGNIRILDNYSFVQVRDLKADEIIESLTGLKFRGRTLTVNYAKPKADSESENENE